MEFLFCNREDRKANPSLGTVFIFPDSSVKECPPVTQIDIGLKDANNAHFNNKNKHGHFNIDAGRLCYRKRHKDIEPVPDVAALYKYGDGGGEGEGGTRDRDHN